MAIVKFQKITLKSVGSWIVSSLINVNSSISGEAFIHDAKLRNSLKDVIICTDSPYYDNIGYSDLSDFFYVLMKISLKGIIPEYFKTVVTPKKDEIAAIPSRFENDKDNWIWFNC